MKLCENQKIVIILAISAIWVVSSVFLYVARVIETPELMIAYLTLLVALSVPPLLYLFLIRRRIKGKQRRKLNNEVFKKWKEVSVYCDGFHVEYAFKTTIEPSVYEHGKQFLDSSKDTRKISTLWGKLGVLKADYNDIGNRLQETVKMTFSTHYPSLKGLREFSDSFYGDCFATSNVLRLLDETSLKLLNNEAIDWTKLVHIEKYTDTRKPTFRLVNQGVLIQSRVQNSVDKGKFQSVMEKLKPRVIDDMKQLTALYGDINKNMDDFKRKMNQLSYDIDTHV